MVDLIHKSLAHGEAVVIGTADHALLVYGADYDGDGKPLSYLVKDSMAPYLYRAEAESLHQQAERCDRCGRRCRAGIRENLWPDRAGRRAPAGPPTSAP